MLGKTLLREIRLISKGTSTHKYTSTKQQLSFLVQFRIGLFIDEVAKIVVQANFDFLLPSRAKIGNRRK